MYDKKFIYYYTYNGNQHNTCRELFYLCSQKQDMNTKLTLTIERAIIEDAKKYARKRGRSLSDLVEHYLKTLTDRSPQDPEELSPVIKSLKGSFKMPKDFDYKKELTNRLSAKHK